MARPVVCPSCFCRVKALVACAGICRRCARDRETLVPDLAERTRPRDHRTIERRLEVVRAAKADRVRRGFGEWLPLEELDRLIPDHLGPKPCARRN